MEKNTPKHSSSIQNLPIQNDRNVKPLSLVERDFAELLADIAIEQLRLQHFKHQREQSHE